jgi:hypothetical protein
MRQRFQHHVQRSLMMVTCAILQKQLPARFNATTRLQHGKLRQSCDKTVLRHALHPEQGQLSQAVAHAGDAHQTAVGQGPAGVAVQPQCLHWV